MINKSESNLLPSGGTFGYMYPTSSDDPSAGWDLNPYELNPYWVSGFVDAKACLTIRLIKNKSTWYVRPVFQLVFII